MCRVQGHLLDLQIIKEEVNHSGKRKKETFASGKKSPNF